MDTETMVAEQAVTIPAQREKTETVPVGDKPTKDKLLAAARTWLNDNGHEVGTRGRIGKDKVAIFLKANPSIVKEYEKKYGIENKSGKRVSDGRVKTLIESRGKLL
jgi:hypothetical protein